VSSASHPTLRLKNRANVWALKLEVKPRFIRVQKMRRRWGSCSARRAFTFSVELGNHDPGFQDLVIIHELLHLRISNHGRLF